MIYFKGVECKVKEEKKIFIACSISKYLTDEGLDKEFEMLIKGVHELCKKYTDNGFLALKHEKFGHARMLYREFP